MTSLTLPHVPLFVACPDTARRARIIVDAIEATPPDGAPSAYYAQVAEGFEGWAREERESGNDERAAMLEADAAVWRARAQ